MQPPDRPQRRSPLLSQLLQRRRNKHPNPLIRGQDHRCPILSRVPARRNGHTPLPRLLMPHSLVPQSPAELRTGGRVIRSGEPKRPEPATACRSRASVSAATPPLHCKVSIFKAILTPDSTPGTDVHTSGISARHKPARPRARPTLETAINQGSTYACRGMEPTPKRHGLGLSRRGRLSPSRVPHVCPTVQPGRATCTSITPRARPMRSTPCLRNEKIRGSSPLSFTSRTGL
jgi:hypothetical protein